MGRNALVVNGVLLNSLVILGGGGADDDSDNEAGVVPHGTNPDEDDSDRGEVSEVVVFECIVIAVVAVPVGIGTGTGTDAYDMEDTYASASVSPSELQALFLESLSASSLARSSLMTRPCPRFGPRFLGTWSRLQVSVAFLHCWHGSWPSQRIPRNEGKKQVPCVNQSLSVIK